MPCFGWRQVATRSHEEEDRVKESHPQARRAAASLGHQRNLLILVTSDWQKESWTHRWGCPALCRLPRGSGNRASWPLLTPHRMRGDQTDHQAETCLKPSSLDKHGTEGPRHSERERVDQETSEQEEPARGGAWSPRCPVRTVQGHPLPGSRNTPQLPSFN